MVPHQMISAQARSDSEPNATRVESTEWRCSPGIALGTVCSSIPFLPNVPMSPATY